MEYFVSAEKEAVREDYKSKIADFGSDITDSPEDAVLVSVGGDGSIMYNVSVYDDMEAVLPVRHGGSAGNRCTVDESEFEEALRALERDDYRIDSRRKLSVFDEDGEELAGDFSAIGEIGLHHTQPNRSAMYSFEISDPEIGFSYSRDEVQGDGIVISTPFGSTGYFQTITGGSSFEEGLGVAFNNTIRDPGTKGLSLSGSAEVRLRVPEKEHRSAAKLFPDIAREDSEVLRDPYQPETGEEITVRFTDRAVELLEPDI